MEEVQPKIQQSLPGPLLPGSNLALLCESLMTCVVQASSPESRGFKCDMSSVYVCVCMCMCVFQVCVIVQRRYLLFSRSYFLLIRILFLYIFVIFMCFLSPVLFGNPSRGAVSAFGVSNLGRGVPQVLGVEVSDAPCRSLVDRQGVELRVAFNLEHLDV